MRNLLMKIGKDLRENKWIVALTNETHTFTLDFQDGFPETNPYPGGIIKEDCILEMIQFLQQTLAEEDKENE